MWFFECFICCFKIWASIHSVHPYSSRRIDEPVSFLKICRVREVFYILIAEMVTWLFIYQNSWNSTLQRGVSFSVYKLYLNKPDFKT